MPGLLRRLVGAFRPERRDWSGDVDAYGLPGFGYYGTEAFGLGLGSYASLGRTAYMAEQISTITAAVSLISATIGSLPAFVYKREGDSRVEAPTHAVARLLKAPNARQTKCDFFEWLTAQMLLHGNALAIIEHDGNGQASGLVPVPWPYVNPIWLPESRRLAFDVLQFGPWGGTGLPRRVFDTDVLHLRDRSDDGYLGRSRLHRAPQVIQAALGIQEFSTAIWRNSANPSGILSTEQKLSAEARVQLVQQFTDAHQGARNARKVPVLEQGLKFLPMASSPEDAEVLASRRFSAEDAARLMGVPPPLVGIWDHSSFGSPASAASWFGTFCILPIVRKIEAEFLRTVFLDPAGPFHLELDMSGLMRADPVAQQSSNLAALAAGAMTVDEVRAEMGLNPLPAAAAPLDGAVPGSEPGS
jgi:HK97 family phage portal protein